MVGFWIWMVWGSHISKAQWAWILPPTDGQPKWLGHSAFSPPFGTHDGLEIHPISKRVTFQLEKQANNRDLKKKMDINVSYGSFPLSFGSTKIGRLPSQNPRPRLCSRSTAADSPESSSLAMGGSPVVTMVQFNMKSWSNYPLVMSK